MRIDAGSGKEARREFFDDLYHRARGKSEGIYDEMTRWVEQYKGSDEIDGSYERAKVVRNITYELIESQVSGYVPVAKVTSEALGDDGAKLARNIERLSNNIRDRLPFEELNDLDERYTYVYGASVWLVEWDNSIVKNNTVGGVKVSCLPPHKFTGQPGINDLADMEYCFIEFDATKDELVRKYGVSYEVADGATSEDCEDEDIATVYICFYRNEDGKVCQFVWSGEETLADVDDYYGRKLRYCTICGEREELCRCDEHSEMRNEKSETENDGDGERTAGGDGYTTADGDSDEDLVMLSDEDEGEKTKKRSSGSHFEVRSEEYEELDEDIKISDNNIIPKDSLVRDEMGNPIVENVPMGVLGEGGMPAFEEVGGVAMPAVKTERKYKTEKTRLPFYALDVFPIVIRKNTSKEDSLFGQSDCEFIRPQQQEINKLESRISEKLMRSGVIPLVPEDHEGNVTNEIMQMVVRVKQGQKANYDTWDLTPDISKDIAEADRLYEQAKRVLGISSSFQGHADTTAKSGKAKEIQAQQSAGRLESKKRMKHAAYARIYEIMFKYHLAYADEPRPLPYKDALGRLQGDKFNRYAYAKCDERGRWYWDDGFTFAADGTADMERLREELWEQIMGNLKNGAYGDPADPRTMMVYWLNLERAGYPYAHENAEYFRELAAQMNQQAALEEENAKLEEELNMEKSYDQYVKMYKDAKAAKGALPAAQVNKGGAVQ